MKAGGNARKLVGAHRCGGGQVQARRRLVAAPGRDEGVLGGRGVFVRARALFQQILARGVLGGRQPP